MPITILSAKPTRKHRPTKNTKVYATLEALAARLAKIKGKSYAVWPNPPKNTRDRIETLVGLRRRSNVHLGQFTTDKGQVVVFLRSRTTLTGRTLKRTAPKRFRSTTRTSKVSPKTCSK